MRTRSALSTALRLGLSVSWLVVAACQAGHDDRVANPTGPTLTAQFDRGGRAADDAALDAVLAGNAQSILAAPTLVDVGKPLPPFVEARLYAIVNVAMHDALNGIKPEFARYADHGAINRNANAAAAALTAAHDAIVGAAPGAALAANTWYAAAIAPLAGADGVADGVAIGHRAAAAILSLRVNDKVATGGVAPFTPGPNPGDYQFTFPFNTPGFDFFGTGGFADASIWGTTVTPFVVTSASQFRAPKPYGAGSNTLALQKTQYVNDFNEILAIGCAGCAARTAVQTEIAKFWAENSPTGWNRIARTIATQQGLKAREAARLLALLQLGEFDSYTTSLESKYYYQFWRPVTAMEKAGVVGWQVVVFPTPPVPDYPSAHAMAGGTAAEVIEEVINGRIKAFSTTSGSLASAVRTFSSVAQAARENADSRVYIGYHFRHATDVGLAQGRLVGRYIVRNALQRLEGDD